MQFGGTKTMANPKFLEHFLICYMYLVVMDSNAFGIAKRDRPFFTSLGTFCNMTTYPNTCYKTLAPLINPKIAYDSRIFYNLSVEAAKNELLMASKNFAGNGTASQTLHKINDKRVQSSLRSCREILDLALYYLNWTIPTNGTDDLTKVETRENFRTWLSGVGALLETCKDEFDYTSTQAKKFVLEQLENSTKTVGNSLAIIHQIDDYMSRSNKKHSVDAGNPSLGNWPPTWLSDKDKMLLENSKVLNGPNVIVATDGSGNYTTITAALNAVSPSSDTRFIIYVKKGVYFENVRVEKEKWNVLMFGDGMDQTIISSNLSHTSGVPTFQSATLAVFGKGFIAQYMGFQNTAGPAGYQAVALLSTADQSVFYRCRVDGYQDTLYAHSMLQFYRECRIYGTIDFIFGQAAVVIQNNYIFVKRPLHGQSNVITAQGKYDPASNSGTSIQYSQILPAEDLTGVSTFLGRPWGNYATTIFMECFLGSLIDPQGWLNWLPGVTPPDTIYYAEYMNTGVGADTKNRVNWTGVKASVSSAEASKFTVRSLIRGLEWLPGTGVPFQPDL